MDFGPGSLKSFQFVPEFEGNRDLPEGERITCEILRPTTAQRLAMESETPGALERWRDTHFKRQLSEDTEDQETREAILAWDRDVLHVVKTVCTHTREWRNVLYDGRTLTQATDVCLLVPLPMGKPSIIREAYTAVIRSSSLTGADLKNFVSQCAGISSETTPDPTAGATASAVA